MQKVYKNVFKKYNCEKVKRKQLQRKIPWNQDS